MAELKQLAELGQSIWYDNIRRALLDSGELEAFVEAGIRGVTSNPTIFEKAIAGSVDYDGALHELVDRGIDVAQIYETLVLEDIGRTADLLRPVYEESEGLDGYVSLEVNPMLAYDTRGTVLEAKQLFKQLARPNVMIKVPATADGASAITPLIAEGINVNVTLIFSLGQYAAVTEAYISGLERRLETGAGDLAVASVASFFVSRVDTAVDRALSGVGAGAPAATDLMGKTAVANAKLAYKRFREIFSGERWDRLAEQGAQVQRPLWASTSTKSPTLPDTLYIDSLIGPDTVNTVPPATLQAFLDHGTAERTVDEHVDQAEAHLQRLSGMGIDLAAITRDLQEEGVAAFARSFEALMDAIAGKRDRLLAGWEHISASLNGYEAAADQAVADIKQQQIISRIWAHDHSVWKPDSTEIANRLGWLHAAEVMMHNLRRLEALADSARADGYTQALLLGMGGSSLAPEVLLKTFGVTPGYLEFGVLDSTDPGAVLSALDRFDPLKTLYVVATKSGGTVETLSLFKYFYNQVQEREGSGRAGPHFLAITDPGSSLSDLAEQYEFRGTFLNDPNIGGRYSALSFFGLAPAALMGIDIQQILDRALAISCASESCVEAADNPAAWLGAMLGELALMGRDKLTLITSDEIESFGDWLEQLIAESTGKDGKGVLPVVHEPLSAPSMYGDDRVFVNLYLDGDDAQVSDLDALQRAGHPVIRIRLHDVYDLGGQFFLWEMATAVAGYRMGINPFDQPNVEAAKVLAREMVAQYQSQGSLPSSDPSFLEGGLLYFGPGAAETIPEALSEFLDIAEPGDYVAVQAYLKPDQDIDRHLRSLRIALRDRTRLATTVGYGPRFLHSTGQLHKGDAGNGLFLQITASGGEDVPIPDQAGDASNSWLSFGVLKAAQAIGDRQALEQAGRRVISIHIEQDVGSGLATITQAVG